MNFHILTLFPEMVMQGLNTSITGRAVQQNKIGIEAVNIRDFSRDKHGRVDDYTYGGGAGMLMRHSRCMMHIKVWQKNSPPRLECALYT